MRRHAKASYAGPILGWGNSSASDRAAARRDASLNAEGTGAPFSGRFAVVAIALLSLVLMVAALLPGIASASQTRAQLGFSPITGSGISTSFHALTGLGVDEANGNIFVNDGDGTPNNVDILGGTGGLPTGVASPYSITGVTFYYEPSGAAVDNSATSPNQGTLYIADVYNFKVEKYVRNVGTEQYEMTGELTPTSGGGYSYPMDVTTDKNGNVYVSDWGSQTIIKFSPTGTQLARVSTAAGVGYPSQIAVDNAGDIFVSQYRTGKVTKYPANGGGEIEAGTFTTVVPSSAEATGIAMDKGTNKLYVALGGHVAEFNAATLAKGLEFGAGEISQTTAVEVNSAAGRIYVGQTGSEPRVFVFGPVVTVPDVVSGSVDRNTTNVTLHGTVNPDGVAVSQCYFETTTDSEFLAHGFTGATKTNCASMPGSGTSPEPVSANVTGLTASSNYRFRLVAANANGKVSGSAASFSTLGPQIRSSSVDFPSITETTATLKAKINPGGEGTTYHFEYVTQAEFDQSGYAGAKSAPAGITGIGHGTDDVDVAPEITGLTPETTYHARLIVSNASGTGYGSDLKFSTFPPQVFKLCSNNEFRKDAPVELPDCRAYEQASPVDKDGNIVGGLQDHTGASIAGDAVAFQSNSGIPGGVGSQYLPIYVARRGANNWFTRGILPPPAYGQRAQVQAWTPDLKFGISKAGFLGAEQIGAPIVHNMLDDTNEAIWSPYIGFGEGGFGFLFVGSPADDSKIFFEVASGSIPVTSGPAPTAGKPNLYMFDRESGELTVVGVLPAGDGGAPPPGGSIAGSYDWANGKPTTSTLARGGASSRYYTQSEHVVSEDGDTVFFTAGATGQVYMRTGLNGGSPETTRISASKKTTGGGPGGVATNDPAPAAFQAASSDGTKALFTSSEELTNEANTGNEPPPPPPPVFAIGRSALDGSGPNSHFLDTPAPSWIAVDSGYIYWTNTGAGTIGRAEISGANPNPNFITGLDHPQGIAVDSGHLYWAEARDGANGNGSISRATLAGGTIESNFIPGANNPQGVAVDATHIYWANKGNTDIGRATIAGGSPNQSFIVNGGGEIPSGVAVDATTVYWTDLEGGATGYVIKEDISGSGAGYGYTNVFGSIKNLIVDSNYIYWSTTQGSIGRMNLNFSGSNGSFITGVEGVNGLAVDGSHVYWATNQTTPSIPPSPGNDLYLYEAESNELTDLTADNGDVNGAEVIGVMGASDDANRVYFAANGDLDGGGPATHGNCEMSFGELSGACSLYVWDEGATSFVAPLDSETGSREVMRPYGSGAFGEGVPSFVSADGSTVVFRTGLQLTSYDNTPGPGATCYGGGAGCPEYYRYHIGDPGLICVTCNPTGAPPRGTPILNSIQLGAFSFNTQPFRLRNLSADGNRFFFESKDKLVAADTNGDTNECTYGGGFQLTGPSCQDVYEWEANGSGTCEDPKGCFYLLSTGKEDVPAFFGDAGANGDNVFIFTFEPLVPQDSDELMDNYDVRVGGGLSAQYPVTLPSCEGDACRGQGTTPPGTNGAGTAVFEGPENPKGHHKKPKKPRHKKPRHKKHQHRHTNKTRRTSR